MREACAYLTGEQRHPRLHELVLAIGGEMLMLGGLAPTAEEAEQHLLRALSSGTAAEKFAQMVAGQDGPADLLQKPDRYLAVANHARPLLAGHAGWIDSVDMAQLGLAVVRLGGGRFRTEDSIDHGVGLSKLRSPGEYLSKGEELLTIHARNASEWEEAAAQCRAAIHVLAEKPSLAEAGIILDRVRAKGETIA
jgi:thymidine phosphorylase